MDGPDVEIEFERDSLGKITKVSYKAHNVGDGGKRIIEGLEIAHTALQADGPEDHSIRVDVDVKKK